MASGWLNKVKRMAFANGLQLEIRNGRTEVLEVPEEAVHLGPSSVIDFSPTSVVWWRSGVVKCWSNHRWKPCSEPLLVPGPCDRIQPNRFALKLLESWRIENAFCGGVIRSIEGVFLPCVLASHMEYHEGQTGLAFLPGRFTNESVSTLADPLLAWSTQSPRVPGAVGTLRFRTGADVDPL